MFPRTLGTAPIFLMKLHIVTNFLKANARRVSHFWAYTNPRNRLDMYISFTTIGSRASGPELSSGVGMKLKIPETPELRTHRAKLSIRLVARNIFQAESRVIYARAPGETVQYHATTDGQDRFLISRSFGTRPWSVCVRVIRKRVSRTNEK